MTTESLEPEPRELSTLLAELRHRESELISSQVKLAGLVDAVRALAQELSLDLLLHRLVEEAVVLAGASYSIVHIDESSVFASGLSISAGELEDETQGQRVHFDLRVDGADIGIIFIAREAGAADFSDADLQVAQSLVVAACIGIQNALLYADQARRRGWIAASNEITNLLLDPRVTRDDSLSHICQRATELAGADYTVISLIGGGEFLRIEVGFGGQRAKDLIGAELPLATSLSGLAMATGEIIVSEDPSKDPRAWWGAPATTCTLLVPLKTAGNAPVGVMSVTYGPGVGIPPQQEQELIAGFAAQAALALEFAEAQLARDLVAILEDRDRIAQELTDLVIQRIFAIGMSVESVVQVMPAELRPRLTALIDDIDTTIKEVRRTIFQLQQEVDGVDVREQMHQVVSEILAGRDKLVSLDFIGDVSAGVSERVRPHLMAVLTETLSNALRHGHANSIDIAVSLGDEVIIVVADDGVGIGDVTRRSGIANLERRAEELGGEMALSSSPTGGTVVSWRVPA